MTFTVYAVTVAEITTVIWISRPIAMTFVITLTS